MKITVIGSINMDFISLVKELPKREETITALGFHTAAGGKGSNQAVAAQRLGAKVYMLGALGDDPNGKDLAHRLGREGVDIRGVKFVNTPTGNAMITVDQKGSNTIVVFPGSNYEVNEELIDLNLGLIEESQVVVLQMEIPIETVIYAIKKAKELGKTVILNPAPAKELPDDIYKFIDYITPNETELETLTGLNDIGKGAEKLINLGVKRVIVTLGAKGCLYLTGKEQLLVEPFDIDPVDTTAAGDAFNGAFALALIEGKNLKDALAFSNAAGAFAATKLGAQESLPTRQELEEKFKIK